MRRSSLQLVIGILVALPVLAGCGELKKLDQMRKSTDEMNRTTSEMNQTTRELLEETRKLHSETQDLHSQTEALYKETQTVSREAAKLGRTTDELLDVTRDDLSSQMRSVDRGFAELYDALRQGDSATLRRMSFQKMLEAKTVQNRIAEAGLFLMAFEYQLFSGIGQDISQDRKDILYQQAMMELFLRIDELAPNGEKIAPLASPQPSRLNSRENRASAFNALAAALHKTNRKQEVDSQHKEQVSVYALIIEALRMKPLYDSGQVRLPAGPHYAKEVLARPARVRQLLQTRHNMFVMLFLGSATDLLAQGRIAQGMDLLRGIEVDLSTGHLGAAHLDFIIEEVLRPAVETRRDMIAVGLKPQLTRTVQRLASRVRFKTGEAGASALQSRQSEIQKLWAEAIGQGESLNQSDTSEALDEIRVEDELK